MKKLTTLVVMASTLALVSCGSSKKEQRELEEREHENIQRDYIVRDASSSVRPGWIEDAQLWAQRTKNQDTKKYRYFSFEAEPKSNRRMACSLSGASAKTGIAGEISTFIERTFATAMEGDSSINENDPQVKAVEQYMSENLVEKIVAEVNGAQKVQQYWEKRQYLKDKGAKRDYTAHTCALLYKMPKDILKRAVENAARPVVKNAPNGVKDKVRKAMENASTEL